MIVQGNLLKSQIQVQCSGEQTEWHTFRVNVKAQINVGIPQGKILNNGLLMGMALISSANEAICIMTQLPVMAYHSQIPGPSRLPLEVYSVICHLPYSAEHTEDCIIVVCMLSLSFSDITS